MKELHVHEITGHSLVPAKDIPALLDENHIEFQAIDCVNWKDYPYRPEVEFRIAHTGDAILLNYRVKEESVRAVAAQQKTTAEYGKTPAVNSSSSFPKTRKKISTTTLNATVEVLCSSVVEDRATDLMHQWKSPEK